MKLRLPAYPIITIDPYFSVWSQSNTLNESTTVHWTGKPNEITATAVIDGTAYTLMGDIASQEKLKQTECNVTALSTVYTFVKGKVKLCVEFTSPLLADDMELLSRPVSFMEVTAYGTDSDIEIIIKASEELCLNEKGQFKIDASLSENIKYSTARMGSINQPVLEKNGDDLRIDYGYFYLTAKNGMTATEIIDGTTFLTARSNVNDKNKALFTFAYDDIYSIEYFGKKCRSLWNNNGKTIETAIEEAIADYDIVKKRCDDFSSRLYADADKVGGEQYAELLTAAYRQVMAAHKLAIDENCEIIWISKECFSNGCAATVDVTYPSSPIFMLYNTELLKGMLRPIFKYAESDAWQYDFAPHDAGTYPLVNGQTYCENKRECQMPVEECGNMLILVAADAIITKNTDFALKHFAVLEEWVNYLLQEGFNPDNQLCTDDFAGHLAHNCNLSLKAICAIGAFGKVYSMLSQQHKADNCYACAKKMAEDWVKEAANGDGSYRLAFDEPDTFSMKYNIVWDKIMNLGLFDTAVIRSEFQSYEKHINKYGLPLDNRADYTKSDWLVWTAELAENKADFEKFISPLWSAFNDTESRVPLTDWYWTCTAEQKGFQNRTVQGGFWIKLLETKNLF